MADDDSSDGELRGMPGAFRAMAVSQVPSSVQGLSSGQDSARGQNPSSGQNPSNARRKTKKKKKRGKGRSSPSKNDGIAMAKFWSHHPLLCRLVRLAGDDFEIHVVLSQVNHALNQLYRDEHGQIDDHNWAKMLARRGFGLTMRYMLKDRPRQLYPHYLLATEIVRHAQACTFRLCKDTLTRKYNHGSDEFIGRYGCDYEEDENEDLDGGGDYGLLPYLFEGAMTGLSMPLCGQPRDAYYRVGRRRLAAANHLPLWASLVMDRQQDSVTVRLLAGESYFEVDTLSGMHYSNVDSSRRSEFYDEGITVECLVGAVAICSAVGIDPDAYYDDDEMTKLPRFKTSTIPLGELDIDEDDLEDMMNSPSISWNPASHARRLQYREEIRPGLLVLDRYGVVQHL